MTLLLLATAVIEEGVTTNRVRMKSLRSLTRKPSAPRTRKNARRGAGDRNGATHCRQCGLSLTPRNTTGVCNKSTGNWRCYYAEYESGGRRFRQDASARGKGHELVCISVCAADLAEIDAYAAKAQMARSEWLRKASAHFAVKVFG